MSFFLGGGGGGGKQLKDGNKISPLEQSSKRRLQQETSEKSGLKHHLVHRRDLPETSHWTAVQQQSSERADCRESKHSAAPPDVSLLDPTLQIRGSKSFGLRQADQEVGGLNAPPASNLCNQAPSLRRPPNVVRRGWTRPDPCCGHGGSWRRGPLPHGTLGKRPPPN